MTLFFTNFYFIYGNNKNYEEKTKKKIIGGHFWLCGKNYILSIIKQIIIKSKFDQTRFMDLKKILIRYIMCDVWNKFVPIKCTKRLPELFFNFWKSARNIWLHYWLFSNFKSRWRPRSFFSGTCNDWGIYPKRYIHIMGLLLIWIIFCIHDNRLLKHILFDSSM